MGNKKLELNHFDWSDLNVTNVYAFPSAKDLAGLSYAAYYQKYKSKATCDISERKKNQPEIKKLPDSWKLIATAQCKVLSLPLFGDGYHGAAYYNVSSKHLVIAHRGTALTNFGSLWADVKGVIFSRYTSHMKSAYQFTRQIVDRFWGCAISISVTGHSLGGWLAQTSAFFIKHPDLAVDFAGEVGSNLSVNIVDLCEFESSDHSPSYHLHVVAFDSPGASSLIESYLLEHHPRYPDNRFLRVTCLNDLDVTTYFSTPNFINCFKMHIGSLFVMPNINTHKMKNIVQFWQSDDSVEKTLLKVTDWLKGLTEQDLHPKKVKNLDDDELKNTKFSSEPIDITSVRMSIFDMEEREFLEQIQYLREHGVIGEKISWETMFKDKPTDEANAIFLGGSFDDFTRAKNIFEFFDSFKIVESQLLKVDYRFKIGFFIRLVQFFVRNSNFNVPKLVKEVISDFPKVYQAIYRALNTEYLKSIAEVQANDFTSLQEFLESSQLRVYEAVAVESTFVCVAKILSLLKSKRFLFGGDENVTLDLKHTLFLSSDLLTILDSHVSIAKVVPPNDNLKLILIENFSTEIQSTLTSLIDKVLGASSLSVKLIIVTPQKINFHNHLQRDISPFYLQKEIRPSDQTISFEYLSIDEQTEVSNSEICFQGEDIQLKNVISLKELQSNPGALDQSTLRCLLSRRSKIYLGGHINTLNKFERSYYIPRHFHKIVLTEPSKLLSIGRKAKEKFTLVISYRGLDARDRILSSLFSPVGDFAAFEWQGDFEGLNPEQHQVILVESTAQRPDCRSFCSHFDEKKLTGLWLNYDTNKWYWQLTFGQVDVELFQCKYEEQCNERDILELQRQLIIVSDEPGKGKSQFFKNLAEICKAVGRDTGKASWVVLVNLESYVDLLREWKESKDFEPLTDLLSQIDGSCSSFVGKCLIKYLLRQDGRVAIFFDGLDEVNFEIRSKVMYFAKSLLDQTKAKIFIASRLHLRSNTEQYFSSYSNTFLPLDVSERINFLTKFWIGHPCFQNYKENSIPMDLAASYARHLLQKLRLSLNITQVDSFIGVPLQLFMLGTMSLPGVCSFLSDIQSNADHNTKLMLHENAVVFDSTFDLYQKFVDEKCHISLKEKLKLKQVAEYHPWHYRQIIASLIELHRTTSFRFLFPNACQEFDCSSNILSMEEIQAMLSVGIVQSDSIDLSSIQFIHRTLAEYFAADFLVSRLALSHSREKVIDFLRKNYFHPQFEKIRYFIDHFISVQPECDSIFRKCLDWEKEKFNIFTTLSLEENIEIYDLLGRNVLHYAICYGNHEQGIFWCLVQNHHLLDKTDVFGCDFLSYMVLLVNVDFPSEKYLSVCKFSNELRFNNDRHNYKKIRVNSEELCLFDEHLPERDRPDLNWIIWFSGSKLKNLSALLQGRPSVNDIRAGFKEIVKRDNIFFNEKQIEKFLQIVRTVPPTELEIIGAIPSIAVSDDVYFVRQGQTISLFPDFTLEYFKGPDKYHHFFKIDMFTTGKAQCILSAVPDITLEYLKRPDKILHVFKVAMLTSGATHVDFAQTLYTNTSNKDAMLALMVDNDFSLFKIGIEFIDQPKIEYDLWSYCKTQRKEKEMFDAVTTTKFLTFRRLLLWGHGYSSLINEYFEFCEKLDDENVRKELIHILRNVIDELFQRDFLGYNDYLVDLGSIFRFLPLKDREEVLEENYDSVSSVIQQKTQSGPPGRLQQFVSLICEVSPEVGRKYKELL